MEIQTVVCDPNGMPVNSEHNDIEIKFFESPISSNVLLTENVQIPIKKGWLEITLNSDQVLNLIKVNNILYAEIIVNGSVNGPRMAITSKGITTISNQGRLNGRGDPTGLIEADPGTLYYDLDSGKLYIKFGENIYDWKSIQ